MVNPILASSISVGFETLRTNPLRTILSTLGIVIGVAALVSVLSVGDGMERVMREQIGATTDLQRISVQPRMTRLIDGTPFPQPNPVKLTAEDAAALGTAVGAAGTVNMVAGGSALVTTARDTTPHPAQITGMLRPGAPLSDSLLVAGRVFTLDEGSSGAHVVVVSNRIAQDVARGRAIKDVVGDTLLFQGQPRVVIGVAKAAESDRARRAMMPVGALAGAIVTSAYDRPTSLTVTAATVEDVKPTRQRIEGWAAKQFGKEWKERVAVVSDESRLDQVEKGLRLFKLFMGALMSISLVVGGIGIMNVLLSSVIERTREIGIRKAAGAEQRHILWQFLCESVAITSVGSLIGLVLGVGAAFGITALMRHFAQAPIHAWLSVSTVATAIVASVVVGLVFGLYPAMRAARLSPIEAIHHE